MENFEFQKRIGVGSNNFSVLQLIGIVKVYPNHRLVGTATAKIKSLDEPWSTKAEFEPKTLGYQHIHM